MSILLRTTVVYIIDYCSLCYRLPLISLTHLVLKLEPPRVTTYTIFPVCVEAAAVNDTKAVFMRLGQVFDKSSKYKVGMTSKNHQ